MATVAFVVFWVLVAFGLLFIAMSGGARGARERLHRQSRGTRTAVYVTFALALLVFGIGIPAAVVAGVAGRESIPESNIANLTDQEEHGRELFAEQCRICHALQASNAVAQVGPDLDRLRPTKGLVLDAIKNGRARGNGAMARDLVVGEDAEAVAAYVAKAVGQTEQGGGETEQGGAGQQDEQEQPGATE